MKQPAQRIFTHIFPGRLQVPHRGHYVVAEEMLNDAKKTKNTATIFQVDLPPNDLNPHNTRQIKEMFGVLFPNEIASGALEVLPLSSLNCGGLTNEKLWHTISGNNPSSVKVFFGKKLSKDDQIGDQHYIEYLAQKYGFIPQAVAPVKSRLNGQEEISASNMLRNPYHKGFADCVDPKVLHYMAKIWQTAFDEGCKICEVENPHPKAYENFLKNFQKGKLLAVNRYGEAESVDAKIFLGKTMNKDNMPDQSR